MENNQHQGKISLHDLGDLFLRKKSAMTILNSSSSYHLLSAQWVQHVLQGMPKIIFARSLEDLLGTNQ